MTLADILSLLQTWNIPHQYRIDAHISKEQEFFPASLKKLAPGGIYFVQQTLTQPLPELTQSVLISHEALQGPHHNIVVDNPQLLHYRISQCFVKPIEVGIHPTAIISEKAVIGQHVSIGPYCIIGEATLSDGVILKNHVVIEDNVSIGENSFIDSHTVIGASGLAWIWDEEGKRVMQPQLGGVSIGKECILATDITVVRGSLTEHTLIGDGTVIAHGTKIGHGSQIGQKVHMANNVSLAGNAVIGDYAFLGSACVISSNIKVPRHTIVGASALVAKNFEEEYLTLAGVPAQILKRNNFEEKPKGAPQPFKQEKNK